jgi:hypothetical protein
MYTYLVLSIIQAMQYATARPCPHKIMLYTSYASEWRRCSIDCPSMKKQWAKIKYLNSRSHNIFPGYLQSLILKYFYSLFIGLVTSAKFIWIVIVGLVMHVNYRYDVAIIIIIACIEYTREHTSLTRNQKTIKFVKCKSFFL